MTQTEASSPDGLSKARLIIVSNRLPVALHKDKAGRWTAVPGSGGLVTALAPVLRDRGGLWIGWPGAVGISTQTLGKVLESATQGSGFTLKPVTPTSEERERYYFGFANETIWPCSTTSSPDAILIPHIGPVMSKSTRNSPG